MNEATADRPVVLVPARPFWAIVLATLLLADRTWAAQIDTKDDPASDAASRPAPQADETTPVQDEPLAGTQGDAKRAEAAVPAPETAQASAAPLSDEALVSLLQKWLRLDGSDSELSTPVAAAASAAARMPGQPASASSAEQARQAFRDLLNEEFAEQGQPLIADSNDDATGKPERIADKFEFNPLMLLGLAGLAAGGGGGGGGAAIVALGGGSPVAALTSGAVVKGYLKGAIVWRDGDGDS
ncbi:MAG: hypothetical protein FJW27_19935, partial [Acidimicrobiia bacterium]|nr:hypothetical protein [Acidimicrobiia bacterium]